LTCKNGPVTRSGRAICSLPNSHIHFGFWSQDGKVEQRLPSERWHLIDDTGMWSVDDCLGRKQKKLWLSRDLLT
jgi:hypothetical protein